jgi:hypothetical protein
MRGSSVTPMPFATICTIVFRLVARCLAMQSMPPNNPGNIFQLPDQASSISFNGLPPQAGDNTHK